MEKSAADNTTSTAPGIGKVSDNMDLDAFDRATEQASGGISIDDDSLYKACMKSIRQAHLRANRLRASLVLAGLFTDQTIYREVLSVFYVVTKEMEAKLELLGNEKEDVICKKILSLGYRFTEPYERDLAVLYGPLDDWKTKVETFVTSCDAAVNYRKHIRNMTTAPQVAGAAFVLWGALVIGGGAVAMPRAKALVGADAVNVFSQVVGPGREKRKQDFVRVWESLATKRKESTKDDTNKGNVDNDNAFCDIVQSAQVCMQFNNDIFTSLQRNPWWAPYLVSLLVAMTAALVAYWLW